MPITSNELLKELNLSRSTFYYLLKHGLIEIPTSDTGRYLWSDEAVSELKALIREREESDAVEKKPKIKVIKINNRRYLGNKYKLLNFITGTVERECTGINTVADIFADASVCRIIPPTVRTLLRE